MGALSATQAQSKSFTANSPLGLWLQSEINSKTDGDIPAAYDAIDSVHTISTSTNTSGNCTLTITLANGETFTTGNVAFDDDAATIEGLIDTAATSASITGWTNGDISVSGGAFDANPTVLTFDGASVSGQQHTLTVLTDVDGAGGAFGAVTQTTAGQTSRPARAVLANYGIASGVPEQDAAASSTAVTAGDNLLKVPAVVIKELMQEAAAEDNNSGSYYSIQAALYPQDRAPAVEQSKTSDVL